MDGVQLAMQAKLMRPYIKVLFTTGYAGWRRHGTRSVTAVSYTSRCVTPKLLARSNH
jgi:hypothetical protein